MQSQGKLLAYWLILFIYSSGTTHPKENNLRCSTAHSKMLNVDPFQMSTRSSVHCALSDSRLEKTICIVPRPPCVPLCHVTHATSNWDGLKTKNSKIVHNSYFLEVIHSYYSRLQAINTGTTRHWLPLLVLVIRGVQRVSRN